MTYDEAFYRSIDEGAAASAEQILPMVLRVCFDRIATVADFGAGSGAWTREAALLLGIDRVCGVDGPWVPREYRREHFLECDLATTDLDVRADLAICLEVAEHLPAERAEPLVAMLCRSDVVLFSAAVPGQPGTGHVNCQPPAYWAEIFQRFGFVGSGQLRGWIWDDERIEWWYRQNLILFWRDSMSWVPDVEIDDVPHLIHPTLFDNARSSQ